MMKYFKSPTTWFILLALGLGAYVLKPSPKTTTDVVQSGEPIVTITLPAMFTDMAKSGETAFLNQCSACHGINAVGQVGIAPPLIHKIYEPSHHGDASFVRAAKIGVQQHHWPFGDMPPVEGITDTEIADIITYIRELQRVNGIE